MSPEQLTALVTAIVALVGAITALIVQIRHMINHDTSPDPPATAHDDPPAGGRPAG